jgi:group I intron endonuclease
MFLTYNFQHKGVMHMHFVYVVFTPLQVDWIYVGTTNDPHKRFIKHCSKSSKCLRLKRAIKKYGRENFFMQIVYTFRKDHRAYLYEKDLISQLTEEGYKMYNMTTGGYGAPGRVVGKVARRRLSESLKLHHLRKQEVGPICEIL